MIDSIKTAEWTDEWTSEWVQAEIKRGGEFVEHADQLPPGIEATPEDTECGLWMVRMPSWLSSMELGEVWIHKHDAEWLISWDSP